MPYRRLPNTDSARLRALKTAYSKGKEISPFNLAFSQSTFQQVSSFLPSFEKSMLEAKYAYEKQVERNKVYIKLLKKAKIYVSHFIQVVNMAILRGDLPVTERSFFDLDEDDKKTPVLNTEHDIIEWGQKLIDGEDKRRAIGRSPITNPTIAVVRVRYEQFVEAHTFQKTLQKNHQRAIENLSGLREKADKIILDVWNEVENYHNDLEDSEKRMQSEKYGVTYVFRKNELKKHDLFERITE